MQGSGCPVTRRAVLAGLAALPAAGDLRAAHAETTERRLAVDIRDFGAIGDGRTDDTPAFRAMHRHLSAFQQRHPRYRFDIHLPQGHYRYSWNQWLWGLRRVAVIGERASLQCISDSPWDVAKFVLTTNADPLSAGGETGGKRYGCLIRTAEAGSRAVVLSDPADGRRFAPGRFACVISFDQQFGGYPPNCRYFEFAIVTSVTEGTVALDRALRFRHSDDNCEDPSVPESIGRARIIPVDTPDSPLALEQRISGIAVLPNPHARDHFSNVFQAIGFDDLEIQDCRLINLVGSIGRRCRIVNSDVEFAEPDKLVATMEFDGCRIGRISQATGVHRLKLTSCRIDKGSDIQARYVRAERCTFHGASYPGEYSVGLSLDGFTPTRLLEVLDSTFVGRAGEGEQAIGRNPTIGALLTAPVRVGRGTIRIPLADERARILICNLEVGDIVLLGGEFAGTTFCDGRFGVVKAIEADGRDVLIRTTAPVRDGDILFAFRVRQARFQRISYVSVGRAAPLSLDTSSDGRVEASRRYNWTFNSGGFAQIMLSCPGEVQRVTVDVRRPYRGSDPGAFLILTTRTPAFATVVLATDLTRTGLRSASSAGVAGVRRTDLWKPIVPGTFVWDFYTHHSLTDQGWHRRPAGSPEAQASYILSVETKPPWQTATFRRETYPA